MKSVTAELKSPSCDLRELHKQLDTYQESVTNQKEKFDAQLLLISVLSKMDEEFLGKEAWDYTITSRKTEEYCSVILEESQDQWQRVFAFLSLAVNYMGDGKTQELAIPILKNAINQIEGLELKSNVLSPALLYLNEQCMKENNDTNWYKTIFSGLLGLLYMELERFDEAEQIQKNIQSPWWKKTFDEIVQENEKIKLSRDEIRKREDKQPSKTMEKQTPNDINISSVPSPTKKFETKQLGVAETVGANSFSGYDKQSYRKIVFWSFLLLSCTCGMFYFIRRNNKKIIIIVCFLLGIAGIYYLLFDISMKENDMKSHRILTDSQAKYMEYMYEEAEKGNVDYQYKLARSLSGSSELNRINKDKIIDYSEAFKWFRKAAMQGDKQAQYHLGVCYLTGRGVPRNVPQSIRWFYISSIPNQTNETFPIAVLGFLSFSCICVMLYFIHRKRKQALKIVEKGDLQ